MTRRRKLTRGWINFGILRLIRKEYDSTTTMYHFCDDNCIKGLSIIASHDATDGCFDLRDDVSQTFIQEEIGTAQASGLRCCEENVVTIMTVIL